MSLRVAAPVGFFVCAKSYILAKSRASVYEHADLRNDLAQQIEVLDVAGQHRESELSARQEEQRVAEQSTLGALWVIVDAV